MKRLFIALAVTTLIASCSNNTSNDKGTVPVDSTATKDSAYGEKIDDTGAIPMADLVQKMQTQNTLENVKVTGKIAEVCQEMGCWLNVDKGDGTVMMVKMKDHEFFVPKDAAGKTVIFSGVASMDSISVEEQRHYAEDAKKSKEEIEKINTPKYELTFEAAGVIIR